MVSQTQFGESQAFIIENEKVKVKLISFGARLVELHFDGKDMVLGYDTLDGYKNSTVCSGATVGRYANRISGGKFTLSGKEIILERNERGINNLHGGPLGFDMREWEGRVKGDNAVTFSLFSPDGDMGFPGNVTVNVTYQLNDTTLSIFYYATTDQETVLSLTNHSYFNLDGYFGGDCRYMLLQLDADSYLPVDEYLIPTGEVASVENTPFDFRQKKVIGQDYDNCFVLSSDRKLKKIGTLSSSKSGIAMEIETDMPSVQIYTGAFCEDTCGKYGVSLHRNHAVAIETQFYPDSPNHPNFPSTVLRPGEVFESVTRYTLRKDEI